MAIWCRQRMFIALAKSIRHGSTNVGYVTIGWQEGKEIPAFDKIKTEIDKLAIECRPYIVMNR